MHILHIGGQVHCHNIYMESRHCCASGVAPLTRGMQGSSAYFTDVYYILYTIYYILITIYYTLYMQLCDQWSSWKMVSADFTGVPKRNNLWWRFSTCRGQPPKQSTEVVTLEFVDLAVRSPELFYFGIQEQLRIVLSIAWALPPPLPPRQWQTSLLQP